MPSVASEVHQSLSAHAQRANARTQTDTDSREPSTPFADLLDAAAPAEPQPAPRPETTDRANKAKADTDKPNSDKTADGASSAPAKRDGTNAKAAKDAKNANDGDTPNATAPADGKDAKSTEDSDTTPGKPKTDADVADVLDAAVVDPAPAVTAPPVTAHAAPLAIVLPTDGTDAAASAPTETEPDANLIAAMAVAGPQTGKTKSLQFQATGDAKSSPKTGAPDDKPAKAAAPTDTQAVSPETNAAKDGQAHPIDEDASVPDAAHRAAAELLKKFEPEAPAQRTTDPMSVARADAAQNLGAATQASAGNTSAPAANAATNVNGPAQPQAVAVPLAGLAVEIATQAHAGTKHFEIRLDPPELGRIDVKLNVDRDGNVSTKLIADRNDTLDLLKRDSTQLERALQDAGLKTSDNALQFSLRQEGFTHDDTPAQTTAQVVVPDDDPAPLEALRQGYGRLLGLGGGLDIRV